MLTRQVMTRCVTVEKGIYFWSIFLQNGVPDQITSVTRLFQSVAATLSKCRCDTHKCRGDALMGPEKSDHTI